MTEPKVQIITPPTEAVVSLAEAKAWLRVDHPDEDALIQNLVEGATAWCEQTASRAFVTRTLRLWLDRFPGRDHCPIEVPWPRLQSVTQIVYFDSAGVQQTLNAPFADFQVDLIAEPGVILPAPGKSWPATRDGLLNAVRIDYTAGYGAAAAVDRRAKQAVHLLAAHWYENREASLTGTISKELELGLRSLLGQLWHGRCA